MMPLWMPNSVLKHLWMTKKKFSITPGLYESDISVYSTYQIFGIHMYYFVGVGVGVGPPLMGMGMGLGRLDSLVWQKAILQY